MSIAASLLMSTGLAVFAVCKKALTADGTAAAWVLCVIICRLGGITAFIILAMTFLMTAAADGLAGKRADPCCVRRKSGARDASRVLCNVGIPAAALILFAATGRAGFRLVYAAVTAESLSDSLASKLGPLAGGKTVDICTLRPISPGLSGGISVAGSAAALCGAVAVGAAASTFGGLRGGWLYVGLLGFAGCMLDSLLGSLLQVKYVCQVCAAVTEREVHCGVAAKLYKGIRPMNNDTVNLSANALTFALSVLVFVL